MSIKNSNGKKYTFLLKDVTSENVDKRFGITLVSNVGKCIEEPENITKISELVVDRQSPEIISFLDESKKNHKCIVSMIDFKTNKNTNKLKYNCFWCKSKIPEQYNPIGCPIKYVPSQAVKTYHSEISKDKYTIKENITQTKQKQLEKLKDKRISIINNNYYSTDGIFCSFNCCIAYINENKHISMYTMSEFLLLKMYNDIYPNEVPFIEKAPSWRLLHSYGGHLTIEEFRKSFNKIEYKEFGDTMTAIKFKSLGQLFEEKLKF